MVVFEMLHFTIFLCLSYQTSGRELTKGLGAGGNPAVGKAAGEESVSPTKDLFSLHLSNLLCGMIYREMKLELLCEEQICYLLQLVGLDFLCSS